MVPRGFCKTTLIQCLGTGFVKRITNFLLGREVYEVLDIEV
jgi:hypothetical protein